MNNIGQRLLNEIDLKFNDRAHHFPKLIDNPSDYLTWEDVEFCINTTSLFEVDIINHDSQKVEIDRRLTAWIRHKYVQCSKQLAQHINHGHTFVVKGYDYYKKNNQELLRIFEECFQVDCALHAFGGKDGSKSFNAHEDYPCNFIVQVEGETEWKVFKNRRSGLLLTGEYGSPVDESKLEVDLHVTLTPGDAIYIPNRAYHCAYPQGKRLSLSIPCWPRQGVDPQSPDRNYYRIT